MWIGRMRISRTHNLAEQNKRRIGELVFLHDRIERNILAVVPELAIGHVEHDSFADLRPISFTRQEHKLRVWIDKLLDEPRASHAVDFNFLASDPFHCLASFHGSVVLVRGRCSCSLRRASNFHTSRRRADWRRLGWVYGRSQRSIVYLDLSSRA